MHYIDYLKINVKASASILSVIVVSYTIMRFFGLIEPIHISIGTIAQFINIIIFASLWQWWFDSLKN